MKQKSILIGLASNVIWGLMPLYWHLLTGVDALVILGMRILGSAVFTVLLLAFMKRLPEIPRTFRDKRAMRYLVPAAVLITANWGVYIWAVTNGHVLDASLGYYINPLMSFAIGLAVFHERCGALAYVAIFIAALGVAISTVSYGAFPYIALILSITFATYGAVKKRVCIDGVVSIAVETLLVSPAALLYLLLSPAGQAVFSALTPRLLLLFIGAGVLTATPLVLFSYGVNGLPLSTMGILQFVLPTLIAVTSVCFLGEAFTPDRVVAFAFILVALILYTVYLVRRKKQNAPPSVAETGE